MSIQQKVGYARDTEGKKTRAGSAHLQIVRPGSAWQLPSLTTLLVLLFASSAFAEPVTAPTSSAISGPVAYAPQKHDALIAALRAGRITSAQALQRLNGWLAGSSNDIERRRIASDMIVIATGGGRFAEAVAVGRQLSPERLADYALGPLTGAARRVGDLKLQGETIRTWQTRQPAAREPLVQEAFWKLDSGDAAAASTLYNRLANPAPTLLTDRISLLELRAAVAQAKGDPLQAISAYEAINTLQPDQRYVRREASFLLASANAPTTASEEAEATEREHPGTFSALELATLRQQALAQQLRWAILMRDERIGLARFAELDLVLDAQTNVLHQLQTAATQAGPADAEGWRAIRMRLQSDRLLALFERGQYADAIALYDTLRAGGADLPPYALAAAASALSRERRSIEAVPLYEAALAKSGTSLPMPSDIHFGLVYAYVDTGRFDAAQALLDQIEAATPALQKLTPEAGRPNSQYSDVNEMRGFLLLYSDRPAAAQQRFETLTQQAPLNAGYASGAALTERLREHPEAAVARFEAQATNNAYYPSARAGYVEALLDTGEFAAARRIGDSLAADYPDSAEVRDLTRKWTAATGPRLDVDAESDTGGAAIADRSWRVDSRLSSGLIKDAWRVFYDQSVGWGDTTLGRANWARGGLGLNWQKSRWLAEGQVQQANTGPYRSSAAARLDYRVSDSWRLSASYDGNSKETPWKARVAGIGAREANASVGYVVNEARRFDLQLQRMNFSDGNQRNAAALAWRERWISGPDFQMETRLGADTSNSRLQAVPYFSPAHDATTQLAVRGQWLNWKRNDRQFFQIVELSSGGYQQTGFGTGPLWNIRYEHRWDLGPKLQLRYGLSIGSHPYDGVRERQRSVFLSLSLPLS